MAKQYTVWMAVGENNLDAFIPEVWAAEGLIQLEAATVMGNLVHRDFSNEIASFGDIVNTRKPADFEAKRKVDGDDVTVQDATASNVPVALNQWFHTSFMIRDGERSKSMQDLLNQYMTPAARSLAQAMDQALCAQAYQFMDNYVGHLGTAMTKTTMVDIREKMNELLMPQEERYLVVTSASEADLLNVADFVNAEKVGGSVAALRNAALGRLFGIDTFMSQNAPSIASGQTATSLTLNGAHAAGATTININENLTTEVVVGGYAVIAGDDVPQLVTARTTGTNGTLTVTPGLKRACSTGAAITVLTPSTVNYPSNYAAGWSKVITADAFSVAPKRGQLIAFNASPTNVYGTYGTPTTTTMWLDRPLVAGVNDAQTIGIGPAGNYNFAFHRNAIAFVSRPLAMPEGGVGVRAGVASYNGYSMRVTIGYDIKAQGHLVTLDSLAGIKVLDSNLGVIVYG